MTEISAVIRDELIWFRSLLFIITDCLVGDRFLRLVEVGELIEGTVSILKEVGFDVDGSVILAIMPKREGGLIVGAIMRTYRVVLKLEKEELIDMKKQMMIIDHFWFWVSKLVEENQSFLNELSQILNPR